MHLAVDNESMQILVVESTADAVHDCEMFDQLIDSIPGQIDKAFGDGAYGAVGAYKKCDERSIKLVAKPKTRLCEKLEMERRGKFLDPVRP